jgi:hypothetical protein
MKFYPFGVSIDDLRTKEVLLICDSRDDIYPIFPTTSPP